MRFPSMGMAGAGIEVLALLAPVQLVQSLHW